MGNLVPKPTEQGRGGKGNENSAVWYLTLKHGGPEGVGQGTVLIAILQITVAEICLGTHK